MGMLELSSRKMLIFEEFFQEELIAFFCSKLTSQCFSFHTVFFSSQRHAQQNCERKNGDLLSINSHTEFLSVVNAFLVDWRKQYLSFAMPIGLVWDTKVRKPIYL